MSYRALARSAPVTFFVLGVFARLSYAITPLGTTLAGLNALAATLPVAACATASRPAMLGCAVLAGLTQPHVGLLVRMHWSHTPGRGTAILRTAFAYESADRQRAVGNRLRLAAAVVPRRHPVPRLRSSRHCTRRAPGS